MSKFILTNTNSKTDESVAFSTKRGYRVSGDYRQENAVFACYSKLSFINQNFIKLGDDFVAVIGSVIYKDTIGEVSLKMLYNDFVGDVNEIRNNVLGNGAFIIKKGEDITIFCEYLALYHVFYIYDGESFAISNELYDVLFLCKGLEVDFDNFILSTMTFGVYGKKTEIEGVYCLQDNEKIVINTKTGSFKLIEVPVNWRNQSNYDYQDTLEQIAKLLKDGATSLLKHYGLPALSSTGGLDNRLNIAAFMSAGGKPDLFYGIGNSYVTNTYEGDLKVNKLYQQEIGLNFKQISWRCSNPINKDWEELEYLLGMHSTRYAGSKDFNDSYINIPNKLLLFGCLGEFYRINENSYIEDINYRNYTLDEYIDLCPIGFFANPYQLLYKNKERIHRHLKDELLPLCYKWGMDPDNLTAMDDFILWIERMRISDSANLNHMNRHHYCVALNAQYPIIKLLSGIHPRYKANGKFQIDLINKLYPEIMEIPVFSRCMFMKYDKNTGTIKPPLGALIRHKISIFIRERGWLDIINVYKKLSNSFSRNKKKQDFEFDQKFEKVISRIFCQNGFEEGVDFVTKYTNVIDRTLIRGAQLLEIYNHLGIKFQKKN